MLTRLRWKCLQDNHRLSSCKSLSVSGTPHACWEGKALVLKKKKNKNERPSQQVTDSHPLSDLVHVLGQNVVHVPQVRGQELLLGFSSCDSWTR